MKVERIKVRNVLCPTDFSEHSRRALAHAVALAKWYEATVTVAHVIPYTIPLGGDMPYFPTPTATDAAFRASTLEELQRFVQGTPSGGARVDTRLLEGDPSREIEALAASLPADLLVLGTHGRSGFERFLLGSVAEKLVRRALCPVMTVSHAGDAPPAKDVLYERILCAADLWESSKDVIEMAVSLAEENKAKLIMLHVLEGVPEFDMSSHLRFSAPEVRAYKGQLEADARERLSKAIPEDARAWCEAEEMVTTGRAYREILRVAKEQQADVIVMGIHAHGAIDRMFFGSTANHVVREATCPVLTVRRRAHPAAASRPVSLAG